jgi:large subunit ribosomal protein L17
MRHNKKRGMKLGTDASHTKAMKKSLVGALLANDRIKTLDSRAKAIRPDVDRVITWAKKGDLASRRLAIAKVGDKEIVREVFEKAAQGMWADRNGGYTRIMKLGYRKGDCAPMVIMELVNETVAPKKAEKPAETKKAKPKKVSKVKDEAVVTEAAEEAVEEVAEEAAEVVEEAEAEAEAVVDEAVEEVEAAADEAVAEVEAEAEKAAE